MKNNIENGIYIPEEQRNLIPVDEWVKREDPTTAQTVVLVTDFGMLEIAKEDLPGGFNFEGAQKAAAEYRKGFRCPTRHEAIEMYDARFRGLDEAFKKIGGEPATTIGWTSEADPDPEYNSYYAFIFHSSIIPAPFTGRGVNPKDQTEMKKGTIIKRTDYVATMLAIPVGEEHEFTLTGRDYASYMNAVSRFNKNGKAKFEARTASASTIVIKRLS